MSVLKKFSILCGVVIGIVGMWIMIFGHTTTHDVMASICVYLTACAMGVLVTNGLVR